MKKKKQGSVLIEKRNRKGYLYLLPWIIGFLIFQLYPIAMSFFYSLTDYSFGSNFSLVGLANYFNIFKLDKEVKNSLLVTFKFVFSEQYITCLLYWAAVWQWQFSGGICLI